MTTTEQQVHVKGRLFFYGILEPKDELDEKLERCHRDMSNSIDRMRDSEIYSHLNDKVNRSREDHDDTNLALLFSILTDPSSASKFYHGLTLVNRDSFSLVILNTEKLIMEKMNKLQETTRIQILWLTREVIQTGVSGADKLCFALLKQLPAGSTSNGDIYIAEHLMHILLDNRDWLNSQSGLISSVVYTYLSLIPCLSFPALANLREQEAKMCVSLIRSRFNECSQIGRDVVRLLQSVSRIPEFTELWKDILFHPQNISPQYTGLPQILSRRTSRRFISGRVLYEVEIKLNFLLSKVKFGQHRRYQEWFQKKYLTSAESHHLIPELIRFVCCVIHPTNEILASDVIPRWALIGWLISLCQNNPLAFANAKLALFYDWLSYNPDSDNIMNIEPAILLMHHSLRAHPQVTASLLDFLCRMVTSFCPSHSHIAGDGVKAAFRDILHKGVLLSLDPIFESPRIDEDLRARVKATFPEFILPLPNEASEETSSTEVLEIVAGGGNDEDVVSSGSGRSLDDPLIIGGGEDYLQGEDSEIIAAFSDPEDMDEMDDVVDRDSTSPTHNPTTLSSSTTEATSFISLSSVELEREESRESGSSEECGGDGKDLWQRVSELSSSLGDKMLELKTEKYDASRAKLMREVLDLMEEEYSNNPDDDAIPTILAPPLSDILSVELGPTCTVLVEDDSGVIEKEEEGGIGGTTPLLLNEIFRYLSHVTSTTHTAKLILEIRQLLPHFGYFLLHYLCTHSHTPSEDHQIYGIYETFAKGPEGKELREVLLSDLKVALIQSLLQQQYRSYLHYSISIQTLAHLHECIEHETALFFLLLPSICKAFPSVMVGSLDVVHLITIHIDPSQLNVLMYQLLNKEFQLFGRQATNIQNIMTTSLHWESFEQFCVWQLLNSEGPDPHLVIPSLTDMNSKDHPEAISSALLYLKNESSGYSSISSLLSLPTSHAPLVDVIGGRWVSGRQTKCAKILVQFLETLEKKTGDKYPESEVTLVLGHLQRIIQSLNSKQILDVSEGALSKTIAKQFKSYPPLASSFTELNKLISPHTQPADTATTPGKKELLSLGHKRNLSTSISQNQEKASKHEPKIKKRRIANRDELMNS